MTMRTMVALMVEGGGNMVVPQSMGGGGGTKMLVEVDVVLQ